MADSTPIAPTKPAHPTATRRRDERERGSKRKPEKRKRRETDLSDDQGQGRDDDRPIIDDFA